MRHLDDPAPCWACSRPRPGRRRGPPRRGRRRRPGGGVQPQAVVDASGTIHLRLPPGRARRPPTSITGPEARRGRPSGRRSGSTPSPAPPWRSGPSGGPGSPIGRGGRVHVAWNGSQKASRRTRSAAPPCSTPGPTGPGPLRAPAEPDDEDHGPRRRRLDRRRRRGQRLRRLARPGPGLDRRGEPPDLGRPVDGRRRDVLARGARLGPARPAPAAAAGPGPWPTPRARSTSSTGRRPRASSATWSC